MSWHHDAACRGMDVDLFFPRENDWRSSAPAVAVCNTCPVSDECLIENIAEQHGIFGGTTPAERRVLRRRLDVRYQPPEAAHGTQSRYAHYRCRCGPCRAAQSLANDLALERRPRPACA